MASLLQHVPPSAKIDHDTSKAMLTSWTEEDLLSAVQHTPYMSSPGIDGIPY
ncbi:hypothetical protein BX666DRAFT_1872597, partial [Dichotomocladium elegans]